MHVWLPDTHKICYKLLSELTGNPSAKDKTQALISSLITCIHSYNFSDRNDIHQVNFQLRTLSLFMIHYDKYVINQIMLSMYYDNL